MRIGKDIPTVAVVGLGYWGPNLVRVIVDRTDVELRWICDSDTVRLERFARRYPHVRASLDLGDLLSDPGLDAVLLATPVFTHHGLAMRCLEAGKHTYIEKPLAPSSAQARELIETAAARELVLSCGHTFLYSPSVRAIKQLITRGELGRIFFVSSSRVNLGIHQPDVSVIWDLGPHDFSILIDWLGAPTTIRATGRDSILPGTADVAFVTLDFPGGVIANVELSWLAPSKLRRTVIVGSRKMILYEDGAPEPVKIYDRGVVFKNPETFGEYQLSYRTGDILTPHLPPEEPLSLQTAAFTQTILSGRSDEKQLALSYEVVRLAEAAQSSWEQGGVPILLDPEDSPVNTRR